MAATINLQLCADCHCLAARRNAREITRLFDERLRPHGLRTTQFSVLALLALGGGASVNRVADALGVERTTLTRSTTILERRGWVKSDASDDARVRPLRLTESGKRKLVSAYPAWKAAQDFVGERFGGRPA
ncbi:MAG TPA: MarR family winged helix-turn-helix transcriptional regulator [Stellaceae bacterium]